MTYLRTVLPHKTHLESKTSEDATASCFSKSCLDKVMKSNIYIQDLAQIARLSDIANGLQLDCNPAVTTSLKARITLPSHTASPEILRFTEIKHRKSGVGIVRETYTEQLVNGEILQSDEYVKLLTYANIHMVVTNKQTSANTFHINGATCLLTITVVEYTRSDLVKCVSPSYLGA